MPQRSSSESGDSPGEPPDSHLTTKNSPKLTPKSSSHHAIQFASTYEHKIYKGLEELQLGKHSSRHSPPAEQLGDGASDPKFLRLQVTTREEKTVSLTQNRRRRASSADTDQEVGFNVLQVAGWPGRSYAEVVREGGATGQRSTVVRPVSLLPSPTTHRRRRKVRFNNHPAVMFFDRESEPAACGCRKPGDVSQLVRPMSCLKGVRNADFDWICEPPMQLATEQRPHSYQATCHPNHGFEAYEESNQYPWEVIRGRYWWRKGRNQQPVWRQQKRDIDTWEKFTEKIRSTCSNYPAINHRLAQCRDSAKCLNCHSSGHISSSCKQRGKAKTVNTSQSARHQNSIKFKEKVGDRCFNCLARGHKVADCTDPPRCWRCGGSGHISSYCSSSRSRPMGLHGGRARSNTASIRHNAIDSCRRRPSTYDTFHQAPHRIDENEKVKSHIPELDCSSNSYRGESSYRRQRRPSPPPLRSNERREESKVLQRRWRDKEQYTNNRYYFSDTLHTNNRYYFSDTLQVPSPHKHVVELHAGLEQNQYQTDAEMRSKSDAILIVPKEHSPTTQQLEAWFGTVARSRKTNFMPQKENEGSNKATISFSVAHLPEVASPRLEMHLESTNVPAEMRVFGQLWRSQHAENSTSKIKAVTKNRIPNFGEQFYREVVPHSDAIHIIPLLAFSAEQKINLGAIPAITIPGNRTEKSDIIGVPPIMSLQQPTILDELHINKPKGSRTPPSESKMDQPMAKTPTAQEIEIEDRSTVQKQLLDPELVTESNFTDMLKKFKEAVTIPLKPCLLQDSRSR